MKILFEHEGHKIVVSRGIVTSEVAVDGEVLDVCNGFTNNQMKNFQLCGTVEHNGKQVEIKIHVDTKLFHDDVSLFFDGKLVESKKVSAF